MPAKKSSPTQKKSLLTSKPLLLLSTSLAASYFLHQSYLAAHKKSFQGENVLVTGASSGIGALLAKRFAKEKIANLVLIARSLPQLHEVKKEIQKEHPHVNVIVESVDVANKDQIYDFQKKLSREIGDIGVLILNAGIVSGKKFLEQTDADAERLMQVNTMSHFYLTRAFLPGMLKRNKGHIITIASVAATIGVGRMTDYGASKFGAFAFNEALRAELRSMGRHASNAKRGEGVQVLCMCPYYIDTGMFKNVQNNNVPFLIPILKPDDVVERTMLGAKRCEQLVVMPYSCWSIFIARGLLPGKIFDKIMYDVLGVQKTIQGFDHSKTGRASIHDTVKTDRATGGPSSDRSSHLPQDYATVGRGPVIQSRM
uniref:Short-chain dehydrogenase/reductase 3 n=1 Tax=Percolomonas cosmopolitus TaxID=63605 RepID=A0A7S1KNP1_9EUKA